MGIREASRFVDGVGAVTITLVGPFIRTLMSFCLEKADTSLNCFATSGVWARVNLAGTLRSWLSSENVERNSCEAGLSSENGGCVIRLDRARGIPEVSSEKDVGTAENRGAAKVKSDELSNSNLSQETFSSEGELKALGSSGRDLSTSSTGFDCFPRVKNPKTCDARCGVLGLLFM